MLTQNEKTYYSRQLVLPKFGEDGQLKLKQSKIAVVGAGGLACPALPYLVGAGIGEITIIDGDRVSETNLHRQTLFSMQDVGEYKVNVIKNRLTDNNPHIKINTKSEFLNPQNAISLLENHDLVMDCTDNYSTRYLINDSCILLNIPMVYGAIHRFEGQVSVFNYKNGPTYRCIFPTPPAPSSQQNCAEAGVIGILPGMIGMMQATEVIKIAAGIGNTLSGKVLFYNSLNYSFQTIEVERQSEEVIQEIFINDKLNPTLYNIDFCLAEEVEIEPSQIDFTKVNEHLWIDVREFGEEPTIPKELAVEKIPLSVFNEKIKEIDRNRSIILFCKAGARSLKAAEMLKQHKFEKVKSLKGGINDKIIESWKKNLQYSSSMDL